jgi:hypothetical protein
MAWCSSSVDVLDGRQRARHRRLDDNDAGQQLRPDRLVVVHVDRRDTMHHDQLCVDNVGRVYAASWDGCGKRRQGLFGFSDRHASAFVHVRRCVWVAAVSVVTIAVYVATKMRPLSFFRTSTRSCSNALHTFALAHTFAHTLAHRYLPCLPPPRLSFPSLTAPKPYPIASSLPPSVPPS